MSTAYTRTLLLIAALLLVTTGCGGSEPDSAARDDSSPLNELLGIPITDDVAMRSFEEQMTRDAERLIGECMLVEGFQHIPRDPSDFDQSIEDGRGTREYAERQGLGLAALVEDAQPRDQQDPNSAYVNSLSDRERAAYETALWGSDNRDDSADDESGCESQAYDEVYSTIGVLDSFGTEIDALFRAYESDPRIVEIQQQWSRCMRDAGFDYSTTSDLFAAFGERVTDIAADPNSFVDPDSAGDSASEIEENGTIVLVLGGSELTPEAQAEIDGVAKDERAAAVASWDCAEPNRDAEAEILGEYEQQFVDENGDELADRLAANNG